MRARETLVPESAALLPAVLPLGIAAGSDAKAAGGMASDHLRCSARTRRATVEATATVSR